MAVVYATEPRLSLSEFHDVLIASTLGARRPVDDHARLAIMLANAAIIVTARENGKLVGVSRAVSDFAFCCYLSDLAVDTAFQHRGIGKRLIEETHRAAGLQTTLYLVAAPAATDYYPEIGMQPIASGWLFPAQA
jgi:ribosomal protein S18 acetylase RimI-like enzyme